MCKKQCVKSKSKLALPCRQIQTLHYPAALPSAAQRASGFEHGPWSPSLHGPEAQSSNGRKRKNQDQTKVKQHNAVPRLWLTSPRSIYLLIALLRRMARPRRYSTVNTKTENETKRRAMAPTTMPVTVCLMTRKEKMILKYDRNWISWLTYSWNPVIFQSRHRRNSPVHFNAISNSWAVASKPASNNKLLHC